MSSSESCGWWECGVEPVLNGLSRASGKEFGFPVCKTEGHFVNNSAHECAMSGRQRGVKPGGTAGDVPVPANLICGDRFFSFTEKEYEDEQGCDYRRRACGLSCG